jgi:DNA modification methylase
MTMTSWDVASFVKYDHFETKKVIDHEDDKQIYYSDGTKYLKRNALNDLCNKDYVKFQKSWFFVKSPQRKLKYHPASFPSTLAKDFVSFFTKRGNIVLDPFVGAGATIQACFETGRSCIGIDLQQKYLDMAKARLNAVQKSFDLGDQDKITSFLKLIHGDTCNIDEMRLPLVDYVITSPPYWDALKMKGSGRHEKRIDKNLETYYSDDVDDIGNIADYDTFLGKIKDIFFKVFDILKPGKYLTIIIKNVKKGNKLYPLAWDTARILSEKYRLKDERIWVMENLQICPYGYGVSWVSNTFHHYCLNFQKPDEMQ